VINEPLFPALTGDPDAEMDVVEAELYRLDPIGD
jgi:hypothetical protein